MNELTDLQKEDFLPFLPIKMQNFILDKVEEEIITKLDMNVTNNVLNRPTSYIPLAIWSPIFVKIIGMDNFINFVKTLDITKFLTEFSEMQINIKQIELSSKPGYIGSRAFHEFNRNIANNTYVMHDINQLFEYINLNEKYGLPLSTLRELLFIFLHNKIIFKAFLIQNYKHEYYFEIDSILYSYFTSLRRP
jgi:hypothetical protein